MSEIGGFTLDEWRAMPWWPNGRSADVTGGGAGHEREIVVNIDGYTGALPWDETTENIPDPVVEVLTALLPGGWFVQSRGSRVEIHPTGHFAGGFTREDSKLVQETLPRLGLVVGYVHPEGRDE